MAILYGLEFQQQSSSADKPHILSFLSARSVADDGVFEVWNGLTNASRIFKLTWEGQIQVEDGTAAKPSYGFKSDKDNGLYYIGANNIGMSTNGTLLVSYASAAVAITGSLSVSTTLAVTTTSTFTGVTTHGGNVVSDTDSTDDLGTTGVRWANLWVDAITLGGTLAGGVATFSSTLGVTGIATFGDDVVSDTDSTDDLGTTGVRWANLWVDAITMGGTLAGAVATFSSTLGVTGTLSGGVATFSSTLGVTGLITATAGITSGSNIVSDTDSTDDLGTNAVRWANLYVDNITLGGTLSLASLTASGIINTDNTTEATSTTAASLQTDGGIAWVLDAYVGDDMFFTSGAVLNFNAGNATITHAANTLTAAVTTFAITGALTVSTTSLFTGVTTHGGNVVSDTDSTDDLGTTGVRWANLWVDAITMGGLLAGQSATFSTTLGVTGIATFGDDVVSDTDSTDDLGTTGVRWANLWVDAITMGGLLAGQSATFSTTLGVTGIATFGDDVVSDTDSTDDLGATGTRWANLWVDAITMGGTLAGAVATFSSTVGVTGLLTTTAGITSGSNIVSDTDSTDDLGATGTRWANLWVDAITMGGTLAGAVATFTTITGSGILSIDDTTDSTSTITGSIHTDGGVGIALDLVLGATSTIFIGDTTNANMVTGITILQADNAGQIFCLKTSTGAYSTGLTTITFPDVEVDDFFAIYKQGATTGGVNMLVMSETGLADPYHMVTYGGAPATTDTATSRGAMNWFCAEHDGSNGLNDMAANSNGFTWGEINGSAAKTTRMLLKADDGELHLGNTTLVALDGEDDVALVRAMQFEASRGVGMKPTPWNTEDYGVPAFSHEKLMAVGVLGEKDADGYCLMRVQPRFAMNEGAIWQNHVHITEVGNRQDQLEDCLKFLVDHNPTLQGRDEALALLA